MSVDEQQLVELGFHGLAGHSDSPRDLLAQVPEAEALGLGAAFLSERFDFKDADTVPGRRAGAGGHGRRGGGLPGGPPRAGRFAGRVANPGR